MNGDSVERRKTWKQFGIVSVAVRIVVAGQIYRHEHRYGKLL